MKAIILAAGRGSRMNDKTIDRPKCLVEISGKSLLDWQIQALQFAGVREIGIVTGYRYELLNGRGLVEFHNKRWDRTQMVESLSCANKWLVNEPCIVSYSDIIYTKEAVKLLIEIKAEIAITYDPNWKNQWQGRFGDPLLDAETFRLTPESYLAEIGGKPNLVEEVQGQYMGLLRFTPEGWGEIMRIRDGLTVEQSEGMHMTGTLQKVIEAGRITVAAVPYFGEWAEIDTQNDLIWAENNLHLS
jgi:choline kinase